MRSYEPYTVSSRVLSVNPDYPSYGRFRNSKQTMKKSHWLRVRVHVYDMVVFGFVYVGFT